MQYSRSCPATFEMSYPLGDSPRIIADFFTLDDSVWMESTYLAHTTAVEGSRRGLAPEAKRPSFRMVFFAIEIIAGDYLISHTVARAVPSAQRVLTSVFEMGTGDPSQYGHRQT